MVVRRRKNPRPSHLVRQILGEVLASLLERGRFLLAIWIAGRDLSHFIRRDIAVGLACGIPLVWRLPDLDE